MRKLWSISTTVRNPERIRNFLKVLKNLEGRPFDEENQKNYQILLIKNKYYTPKSIPFNYKKYYEIPQLKMPKKVAKEIFDYQNYEDPAMRGRQSANPLNKLGFSIARETEGNIRITELGNRFLEGDYDIGYIFFKSLLKLQFPNPWSSDFSKKQGFDIQPLIATMHLIKKVNEKSERKGLTKTEFSLFIPSLINYKLIEEYSEENLKFRVAKDKKKFQIDFAKKFYETKSPSEKQIKNFFEYGDNIMRYFRLTKYFRVAMDNFGSDWVIDLEPTRKTEIEQLLKTFKGNSLTFNNSEDYLNYISDISLPKLPFEEIENLKEIAGSLSNSIKIFANENEIKLSHNEIKMLHSEFKNFSKHQLNCFISSLRSLNLQLVERQKGISLGKYFKEIIQNIIGDFKDFKKIKKYAPEQFEKIVADALKIINDEIKIKPNYPVDDNGEPINHAPSNKADIECYYSSYNAVCEVTLDTSNFQWVRESQPVMRHLREFEQKFKDNKNFCVFIAPKIHQDTLYHFWNSIVHGYDGCKQSIVPLTTEQFAFLLETFLELIEKQKKLTHIDIQKLYEEIVSRAREVEGQSRWASLIPEALSKWKEKLMNESK